MLRWNIWCWRMRCNVGVSSLMPSGVMPRTKHAAARDVEVRPEAPMLRERAVRRRRLTLPASRPRRPRARQPVQPNPRWSPGREVGVEGGVEHVSMPASRSARHVAGHPGARSSRGRASRSAVGAGAGAKAEADDDDARDLCTVPPRRPPVERTAVDDWHHRRKAPRLLTPVFRLFRFNHPVWWELL